jgi:Na+-driven multidrug efflux pump
MTDPEPDRLDKQIRFGCGFLFGLPLGFLLALKTLMESAGALTTLTLAIACLCGWLAMRYGDKFWTDLVRWFSGW